MGVFVLLLLKFYSELFFPKKSIQVIFFSLLNITLHVLISLFQTTFTCHCCPGFVGRFCEERDGCYANPCQHGGFCVDITEGLTGSTYQCLCPHGKMTPKAFSHVKRKLQPGAIYFFVFQFIKSVVLVN